MNAKHAALALALAGTSSLAAEWVFAQAPASGGGGLFSRFRGSSNPPAATGSNTATPANPGAPSPFAPPSGGNANTPPRDPKVFPASTTLPTPTPPDQLTAAPTNLPDDPIEPYLLTKDVGPFLVTAKTFRGPEAERYALMLVQELRRDYGLPAYILRLRDFPHHSNIRNVPPTAPTDLARPHLADPERVRSYDESAVLVGNEKTMADARELLHRVKKITPKCLKEMPEMFNWRVGLKTATQTVNPFVPAQQLFPGHRDTFILRMNEGPHSVFNCPGRYSLEVAQFGGRSTFRVDDARVMGLDILKRSPLATAHDDAERLAENLAKTPEIQRTGQPIYVYHDRQSSRVMIGAFQSPQDAKAVELRQYLVRLGTDILDRHATKDHPARKYGVDKMLVPATYLTDLEAIKAQVDPSLALNQKGK